MTAAEDALLADLEAWRGARVAEMYNDHYVTGNAGMNGDTVNLCRVKSEKYSRVCTEPEMIDALEEVTKAVTGLEVARKAIVERKLRELRSAGAGSPLGGSTSP